MGAIQMRGFLTMLPIWSMLVPRPWLTRPPQPFSRKLMTAKPTIWAQQPATAAPPARPVRPRAAQMAAEEMGSVSATPTMTDTRMPMKKGCSSVAHMMSCPHGDGRRADGGGNEASQRPTPDEDGHERGDQDVHLGLLAHRPCRSSAATMATTQHRQRAACPAQGVGGVAHGDQGEQHQRRAVQRKADGCGHGRAAHGGGVAAQVHQSLQPGLLAQRFDDGADEQAGKQALRHGTQCLNEVALRGDDDIFPF